MRTRRWLVVALAGLLGLSVAACGASKKSTAAGGAQTLNGAGSTFAAPFYQQWGTQLRSSDDIKIN